FRKCECLEGDIRKVLLHHPVRAIGIGGGALDLDQAPAVVVPDQDIGFCEKASIGDDGAVQDRGGTAFDCALGAPGGFNGIVGVDQGGIGELCPGEGLDGVAGQVLPAGEGIVRRNKLGAVNRGPCI